MHSLVAPDGRRVELWTDANFAFVQAYNPRAFPFETGTGMAIALEPMTAPANAFNTGQGVRWLDPARRGCSAGEYGIVRPPSRPDRSRL